MPVALRHTASPAGPSLITGRQLRDARKLLLWSPDRLAKRARVAVGLIVQAEQQDGAALLTPGVARTLRQIIEAEGLELGDDPAVPVRWRRPGMPGAPVASTMRMR